MAPEARLVGHLEPERAARRRRLGRLAAVRDVTLGALDVEHRVARRDRPARVHALVTARVLRLGRNLVFGEVELHDEEGKMAVHATTTYALTD